MEEKMTMNTTTNATEENIIVKVVNVEIDDMINDLQKATWLSRVAATELVKALRGNEHTQSIVGNFVYDICYTDVDLCMTSTSVLKDIEIEPWFKNKIRITFSIDDENKSFRNHKFYSFTIILNRLGEYRYYTLDIH